MFSGIKLNLRSRSRVKGASGKEEEEEGMKLENLKEEKTTSCSPNFRCQDPVQKFSACSSHGKKSYTSYKPGVINVLDYPEYYKTTEDYANYSRHSNISLPDPESHYIDETYSTISVIVKKTDVFIERDDEGSLGITLQGGAHSDPAYSRPLFVTYVKAGGPADREGTIQIGDRLLSIDGMPLGDVTLSEAYNILKQQNRTSTKLCIEYDVTNVGHFPGPMLVEMESPRPHQLGLTLTNTPHNAAVLIDEIKTGSIAERCGALHSGDQILAVNDTRVEGSRMAATEVYKLLRMCGGERSLLLEILPVSSMANSQLTNNCKKYNPYEMSLLPVSEVPMQYSGYSSYFGLCGKGGNTRHLAVTLHSNDKDGYGMSVCHLPNSSATLINSVTPNGPADKSGVLQVGDKIMLVNGHPLCGVTTVAQPLHKVPGISLGIISLDVEYIVNPAVIEEGSRFTVALTKHKGNLGVTMTNYGEHVVIFDIVPGSMADRSGSLDVGDKILAINNRTVANCTGEEALDILYSQEDSIILEVEKRKGFYNHVPSTEWVEYTVELKKVNGSLGITLLGSDLNPREITISALSPSGVAERTGALHVGDRVLAINSTDTSYMLLSEAMSCLQNSGEKVLIKVSRPPALRTSFEDSRGRIYDSPGLYSSDSAVESWESSVPSTNEAPVTRISSCYNNNKSVATNEAELMSELFKIRTSGSNELSYNTLPGPHFSTLKRGSVRQRNSFPSYSRVSEETPSEAVNEERNQVQYSNVGEASNLDWDIDQIFNVDNFGAPKTDKENEILQVTLYKDPLYEDFGFSVSDGLYERGVFINRIRHGGPAHNSGVLRPYDKIIQVNNARTDNFDCCLTVPLVASAGDKVTLMVIRRASGHLEENTQENQKKNKQTKEDYYEQMNTKSVEAISY